MKKGWSVTGMIMSFLVIVLGVLMISGQAGFLNLGVRSSQDSSALYPKYNYSRGFAKFGGDYYTYVNNNAADAAYYADMAAYNIVVMTNRMNTISGLFMIAFGAFGVCLFGAMTGVKKKAPVPAGEEPAPVTGKDRLLSLKALLESGLITQEDYDRKKDEIINGFESIKKEQQI